MSPIARAWVPPAAWAALIFGLSSIPGEHTPSAPFFSADKVVHALVFGVLAALLARALGLGPRRRAASVVATAAAITALYGVADELHQVFVPGRSPDWRDVMADALGGLAGASLFTAARRSHLAGLPPMK